MISEKIVCALRRKSTFPDSYGCWPRLAPRPANFIVVRECIAFPTKYTIYYFSKTISDKSFIFGKNIFLDTCHFP